MRKEGEEGDKKEGEGEKKSEMGRGVQKNEWPSRRSCIHGQT